MTFHIQVDSENRITDIIQTPHKGYEQVDLNIPLPPKVLVGAYELMENSIIYRKEWDKSEDKQKIAELEATTISLMNTISKLGGLTNA